MVGGPDPGDIRGPHSHIFSRKIEQQSYPGLVPKPRRVFATLALVLDPGPMVLWFLVPSLGAGPEWARAK